jgi:II/X family phage/plasmid replication protein
MYDTFLVLCRALGLSPSLQEVRAVKRGDYPLSMVDINQSYELPTRQDVLAWIRAAEFKSRTRHGRPQMKGGTLYWGKTSQRWALKVYSKGEEIEASKHQLPDDLLSTPIPAWADNKLRLELRIKKKQLTKHDITM